MQPLPLPFVMTYVSTYFLQLILFLRGIHPLRIVPSLRWSCRYEGSEGSDVEDEDEDDEEEVATEGTTSLRTNFIPTKAHCFFT